MIVFKCDRCGQAISPYVHRLANEIYRNTDYNLRSPVNILIPEEEDPEAINDELSIKLYSMQFCRDCFEKIAAYAINGEIKNSKGGVRPTHDARSVRDQQPEPAADNKDELTESEEQEICDRISRTRHLAKGERMKIDLGKMKALWEANKRGADWPITKIADELGCTDSTVHYHLKKMGLKK